MAQQFLNGTQISARAQQVGGKGMAQGVRGGGGGQAQLQAGGLHHFLDGPRAQGAAADGAKQRCVGFQRMRAGAQVAVDGHARGVNHRHDALLVALAGDAQHFGQGGVGAGQGQGLGYAQPATIQQGDHGHIAGRDPFLVRLHFHRVDQRLGGVDCQWAGQFFLKARRAGGQDYGGIEPFAFGQPAVKGFHSGQGPRQGSRRYTAPAFMRHPRAHIAHLHPFQRGKAGFFAKMLRDEGQVAQNIGLICGNGVVGGTVQRLDRG